MRFHFTEQSTGEGLPQQPPGLEAGFSCRETRVAEQALMAPFHGWRKGGVQWKPPPPPPTCSSVGTGSWQEPGRARHLPVCDPLGVSGPQLPHLGHTGEVGALAISPRGPPALEPDGAVGARG